MINKFIEKIKSFFDEGDSIDRIMSDQKERILRFDPHIMKWLKDNGYTVLSKDKRIVFYSYTVVKGTDLSTKKDFSFEEMMSLINTFIV